MPTMDPFTPLLFLKLLFIREGFFLNKNNNTNQGWENVLHNSSIAWGWLISYVTQEAVTTQAPFFLLHMCALLPGNWAVDFIEIKLVKYQPHRLRYGRTYSTGSDKNQ